MTIEAITASLTEAQKAAGLSEASRKRVPVIAKTVTGPMLILLNQHAEGYRSSLYIPFCGTRGSPYWANMNTPYDRPNYMAREGLISRGLIDHYDDAAGITPLGLAVRDHLKGKS